MEIRSSNSVESMLVLQEAASIVWVFSSFLPSSIAYCPRAFEKFATAIGSIARRTGAVTGVKNCTDLEIAPLFSPVMVELFLSIELVDLLPSLLPPIRVAHPVPLPGF